MNQILANRTGGDASICLALTSEPHGPIARIGDALDNPGSRVPMRSFRLARHHIHAASRARRSVEQTKVVFVNRFFFPDESATSQMLSDVAFALAKQGFDVHVVTSRLDYSDPLVRRPASEEIHGVTVHRVWTSRLGGSSLLGRAIDYLTFYLNAAAALVRTLSYGDVLVAKTDPPLISVVGALACRVRQARLVTWLQDLYPEVARAAGVRFASGWLWQAASMARNWSLRVACANVAIGDSMRSYLTQLGRPAQHLTVIHNWADGESIQPMEAGSSPLRREWGLDGRFIVEYSGNLGRVHDYQTLLDVATELRVDERVVFLFAGQGHGFRRLREEAAQRGLSNVMFRPPQPRERLGQLLTLGDVHLVTLAPGMGPFVLPSKLYGVLAAGRPVLFVGGADSEIPAILDALQCGSAVESGDVHGLAQAIRALAADAGLRRRLGANARHAFEQHFSKRAALDAWRRVIQAAHAPEAVRSIGQPLSV